MLYLEDKVATEIHVFSETLCGDTWTADKADTYVQELPNRFGWIDARMEPVPCPRQYWLFGLLVDEVRYSWPWSFSEKGIPEDVSPQVKQLSKSWGIDGYAHSYLTLQELKAKAIELTVDSREPTLDLTEYLIELIKAIPQTSDNPKHQRIVFWFDN